MKEGYVCKFDMKECFRRGQCIIPPEDEGYVDYCERYLRHERQQDGIFLEEDFDETEY